MKQHFCAFQSLNICSFSFRNTPGIEVVCSQKPVREARSASGAYETLPISSAVRTERHGWGPGKLKQSKVGGKVANVKVIL